MQESIRICLNFSQKKNVKNKWIKPPDLNYGTFVFKLQLKSEKKVSNRAVGQRR
jgi:hypothetical protein